LRVWLQLHAYSMSGVGTRVYVSTGDGVYDYGSLDGCCFDVGFDYFFCVLWCGFHLFWSVLLLFCFAVLCCGLVSSIWVPILVALLAKASPLYWFLNSTSTSCAW
jgi:hypothetical protein